MEERHQRAAAKVSRSNHLLMGLIALTLIVIVAMGSLAATA